MTEQQEEFSGAGGAVVRGTALGVVGAELLHVIIGGGEYWRTCHCLPQLK